MEHSYSARLAWSGSTGSGYDSYSRRHEVVLGGKATFQATADSPFLGDGHVPNPEELLLAAASSCQLLSLLAVAARARIDVIGYTDIAAAFMPTDQQPMWVSRIALNPTITLATAAKVGQLPRLTQVAHRECFIAASLRSAMTINTSVLVEGEQVATFEVHD